LERLNSVLDGRQQDQFNYFVEHLSVYQVNHGSDRVAWKITSVASKEHILVAARNSGRFDGIV
jgi:hypothetical protein